jgi:hypothetical protein
MLFLVWKKFLANKHEKADILVCVQLECKNLIIGTAEFKREKERGAS